MRYKGKLSKEEMLLFVKRFYEVDSCRAASIKIEPNSNREKGFFDIVIETLEPKEVQEETLIASFQDGLLGYWGYDKVFIKQ